jgi:hypothetical protein
MQFLRLRGGVQADAVIAGLVAVLAFQLRSGKTTAIWRVRFAGIGVLRLALRMTIWKVWGTGRIKNTQDTVGRGIPPFAKKTREGWGTPAQRHPKASAPSAQNPAEPFDCAQGRLWGTVT